MSPRYGPAGVILLIVVAVSSLWLMVADLISL